jgi:Uma2 family endonuclease
MKRGRDGYSARRGWIIIEARMLRTLRQPRSANGQDDRRRLPRMTEAEFVAWCDSDTWAEWVDGEVIVMSPVNFEHADLHAFLLRLVGGFVEERELGRVVTEPFQIRFAELRRRRSPDIIFISNRRLRLVKGAHFEGGPDLIVEIVSPESQSRDRREKYLEYEAAGVKEYWIVDPLSRVVEAHVRARGGKYRPLPEKNERIGSTVLKGFYLRPEWLWRERFPKVPALLREMAKSR